MKIDDMVASKKKRCAFLQRLMVIHAPERKQHKTRGIKYEKPDVGH